MKSSVFWAIRPCNPLKVNRRFGGTCSPYLQGRRVSQASRDCLLKIEVKCSSETPVDFQRTTWRYFPEDRNLHNLLCENFTFYIYNFKLFARAYEIILLFDVSVCERSRVCNTALLPYFPLHHET
jgi:hypothetical protein